MRTIECAQCHNEFTYEVTRGRQPKRCSTCRLRDPKGRDSGFVAEYERERLVARGSRADVEMCMFIENYLEVSQSEAIRTAIRVYYAILKQKGA